MGSPKAQTLIQFFNAKGGADPTHAVTDILTCSGVGTSTTGWNGSSAGSRPGDLRRSSARWGCPVKDAGAAGQFAVHASLATPGASAKFHGTCYIHRSGEKGDSVKITGSQLEVTALRILREVPGLTVTVEHAGEDSGADAILEFAGGRVQVALQVKTRASTATAWQLVHQARHRPDLPLLLVAGETTAEAREIMAEHGVSVIDSLGNAHIEVPGLLVHMEGRDPRRQARPARLSGKAGVIAQALLLDPGRGWQVKDLAQETGLSLGLAHRVLTRLEGDGIISTAGTGPHRVRRVTDPAALLDLWAEENTDRPTRTPAYLLSRSPRQLIAELEVGLDRSGIRHALTGAAAANVVAPFATAVPVAEVWVAATASPQQLYDAAGADSVTEGNNIVFLQAKDDTPLAFREQVNDLWLANRFRIYCDLRRDPRRGREQADHLRQELIGF
jgi:hypothetical protein